MRLLKDLLIALGVMCLWIALAWWQVNNTTAQAVEMPTYHPKPPACILRSNSYFDYDFSQQPPRLSGWYQRQYVECNTPIGIVVIE